MSKPPKKTIPTDPTRPRKPGNWLKRVGILSGVLWVGAMGAVFAVKGMDLSPANTHDKDGHADADHGGDSGKPAHSEEHETAALDDVPAAAPDAHTIESRGGHHAAPEDAGHGAAHAGPHAKAHAKAHAKPHAETQAAAHAEAHADAAPEHPQGKAAGHPGGGGVAESEAAAAAEAPVSGPASDDERSALRELAEIHAGRGDLQKALHPVRKLMAEPTQDAALLSLAAEVFLGTGHYREAYAAARKALRHAAPGRVDLEVTAVLSQYRMGEVEGAFRSAEAALKKHPRDVDLLTAVGTMEIEMGPAHPRYGKSLEQALKLKPGHVPALYQLGRKAQLQGDYKDAEILFRKVVKRDPKHAKARGQLGTALYHLRKESEARKEFRAALALNPKDYNTWFNLGELCLSRAAREKSAPKIREWRAEAMASYLKAVEWNPGHAEAHFRIGVLLNGNGQYKEAIRHLEAARQVDGRHVPTWVQMAVAYENLKKPERAKACLEKALELDPLDKIVQFKLRQMT